MILSFLMMAVTATVKTTTCLALRHAQRLRALCLDCLLANLLLHGLQHALRLRVHARQEQLATRLLLNVSRSVLSPWTWTRSPRRFWKFLADGQLRHRAQQLAYPLRCSRTTVFPAYRLTLPARLPCHLPAHLLPSYLRYPTRPWLLKWRAAELPLRLALLFYALARPGQSHVQLLGLLLLCHQLLRKIATKTLREWL
jgi:hypothetical protein